MIKSTKRGLLVTFFWYIRPVDQPTLLNTGMTRDGLFLIENGEIAGPVQNFRWNMSPLVGFNNISAVGKAVPIHTGEVVRRPRHGARAAGPDRRLLHDVGVAGGLTATARDAKTQTVIDSLRVRELAVFVRRQHMSHTSRLPEDAGATGAG